jgi:hypothetical protein
MAISDVDNMLLGLSVTPSSFCLYTCCLDLINFDADKTAKKP